MKEHNVLKQYNDNGRERPLELFKGMEKRKEEAPKIVKLEPKNFDQVAEKEGVEPLELENKIKDRVKWLADELKDACSSKEKYLDTIDTLYNLFLLSKDSETVARYPWLSNFISFDRFTKSYCPDASPNSHAYIARHIDQFMNTEYYVSPKANQTRIMNLGPRDVYYMRDNGIKNEVKMYQAEGEWLLMPEDRKYWEDLYKFVDAGVIREIIELIKSGYEKPDFTHSSGSAALAGIARNKALISSSEARKRGTKIRTGEFVTYVHNGLESLDEQWGSSDVYADQSGMPHSLRGYNVANWFDEYYVTFGINKDRQEKFLSTKGQSIRDWGSEGTLIGDEVPLENIDIVYYHKTYEDEAKKWVEKNCPHARTASLEALDVFHDYYNQVNLLAQEENREPIEVWERIIAECKV